jgi:DNA-binding beta-propeller fold protein YncE
MTDTVTPDAVPPPLEEPAAITAAEEPPTGEAGQPAAIPLPEEPPEDRRRRRALIVFLLLLLSAFLLFTGWYLLYRKPVSEIPLPGVTVEDLPQYKYSIYGVTAPTGVAVNADGSRIYATQTEGDPMVIEFDGSGNPIGKLLPPSDSGGTHVPVYVALNPTNGDVYVSDRAAGAIFVYSPDGLYRRTFDPGPALKDWAPLGLGFDSKGDLFVTSLGKPYQAVHEFGPDEKFIQTFGKPDEFDFPNGVSVDAAGNVYVTDSNNGRVVVFDSTAKRVGLIKRGATDSDLGLPRGSAIDDAGRFYVADISLHGVQVYHTVVSGERTPKYIGRFGVEGSADGAFLFPNAVAVDGRSRIYVADWRNGRIQVWGY